MDTQVLTIDSYQTAKNAARMMSKFGVTSLMVSSEGNLVGILTERDIITRVVVSGLDPDDVDVHEIMSEPIIVVSPTMPVDKAVKIMLTERIRKLPVMEKEGESAKLVGILSMTDIAKIQPKLFESLKSFINEDLSEQEILTSFYVR